MNFKHLEYAVAVAKYNSIRKAAQNLFISQPYLSGTIRNLEQELGYEIFTRSSSGISLTANGQEFLKSANHILRELDRIQNLGENGPDIPLNISCYHAPFIMEQFLNFRLTATNSLPDKIRELGNEEVIESVGSHDTDFGIIFYSDERQEKYHNLLVQAGLKEKELLKPMPVYFLMSRVHPLAGADSISVDQISDYPYVTYDDASSRNYLQVLGLKDHTQVLTVSDRGGFYDALQSGRYLTVSAFFHEPKDQSLVIVPMKDRKMYLLCSYITGQKHKLTRREAAFVNYVKKAIEE